MSANDLEKSSTMCNQFLHWFLNEESMQKLVPMYGQHFVLFIEINSSEIIPSDLISIYH